CLFTYLLPIFSFFFFTATATPAIYTLSLHDALPISDLFQRRDQRFEEDVHGIHVEGQALLGEGFDLGRATVESVVEQAGANLLRSEEHTSELQSRSDLVCRLLLEKKKKKKKKYDHIE